MHRQCNITKRVKTAKGLRYSPVVNAGERPPECVRRRIHISGCDFRLRWLYSGPEVH